MFLYVLLKSSNLYVTMNFMKTVRIDLIALSFEITCCLLTQKRVLLVLQCLRHFLVFQANQRLPEKKTKTSVALERTFFRVSDAASQSGMDFFVN